MDELEQGGVVEASEAPSSNEEALDQGVTDALADMAGDGEVSVADLRELPGAEGYTDEQLQEMWDKSQGKEEKVVASPATPPVRRGFKYFGADNNEVVDVDKLTVADFLKGKLGYSANGKEQRKTLEEVLRVAQYGHLNESKLSRARANEARMMQEGEGLRTQNAAHAQNEKIWGYALQQFLLGNDKPLESIIAKVREQAGAAPQFEDAGAGRESEAEQRANALEFWYNDLQPKVDEVAQRYGAKPQEVRNYVQWLFGQEAGLTRARIDEIIASEMPLVLESKGFSVRGAAAPVAPVAAPVNGETTQLKARLAELETQLANAKTEGVKKRNRTLPPGSNGKSNGADLGEFGEVPADVMKGGRKAYKRWLTEG